MTIPKHTHKAKQAIANAKNIRCYALSNNFVGTDCPLEFLVNKFQSGSGKLSMGYNGKYHLTLHSNCWYEFEANA